jgi:SAM-dependent methyltransferase
MALDQLQRVWNHFGRTDPLWAVLAEPAKSGGRWNVEEFFATGQHEITSLVAALKELGLPRQHAKALDFGCGVGRCTQSLCEHFDSCYGVDIAPSMIEAARGFNRFGARCTYHLNEVEDLRLFDSEQFDLVYSNIVLQHIPPEIGERYIAEFVRLLSPGGAAVFQVPSGPIPPVPDHLDFRAHLEVTAPPGPVGPGATIRVGLRVRNEGAFPWPAAGRYPVRLGNHWRMETGSVLAWDDARVALPGDLGPGDTVELTLSTRAPSRPGRYQLQLDLVQEGVAWFADRGGVPPTLPVRVREHGADHPPRSVLDEQPAAWDMYAIPRARVESIVETAGGRLVSVHEDGCSGPEWLAFRYTVTR